jgi:argininosuccinate lyase
VSDRDFALEFLSLGADLRHAPVALAEEIVIWSTRAVPLRAPVGQASRPARRSCRRRRTPTRPNWSAPRPAGSTGRLIALLTVMKGLPLAYSKDMQEDKEQVFDAADTLMLALAAMTGMVRDMTMNRAALAAAAGAGFSTATDLADWLVREAGLPFRDAHHVTGALVAHGREARAATCPTCRWLRCRRCTRRAWRRKLGPQQCPMEAPRPIKSAPKLTAGQPHSNNRRTGPCCAACTGPRS